jgi:chorismate mutase
MDIDELRNKIDETDSEIIRLLSERMETVKEIGQLKKEQGLKVDQPNRETAILGLRLSKAEEVGLDQTFVMKLYEVIFEEAKKLQALIK